MNGLKKLKENSQNLINIRSLNILKQNTNFNFISAFKLSLVFLNFKQSQISKDFLLYLMKL